MCDEETFQIGKCLRVLRSTRDVRGSVLLSTVINSNSVVFPKIG